MPVDDTAAGPTHLRLLLTPDVDAPAAARRALRTLPLGETADDVLLLASELVTNAVLHAGLDADQVIELDADCEAGGARASRSATTAAASSRRPGRRQRAAA